MNQTVYTIIGFTVIFVLNALGSAFVFFFKKDASPKANTLFLGFAAGVMVAASFFSLLLPAFEGAGSWGVFLPWPLFRPLRFPMTRVERATWGSCARA